LKLYQSWLVHFSYCLQADRAATLWRYRHQETLSQAYDAAVGKLEPLKLAAEEKRNIVADLISQFQSAIGQAPCQAWVPFFDGAETCLQCDPGQQNRSVRETGLHQSEKCRRLRSIRQKSEI
jgi:hypothetical protein